MTIVIQAINGYKKFHHIKEVLTNPNGSIWTIKAVEPDFRQTPKEQLTPIDK